MPKSTHEHQKEAINTDRKFRPDDEGIYEREKREFQSSEKAKTARPDHEQQDAIPNEDEQNDE